MTRSRHTALVMAAGVFCFDWVTKYLAAAYLPAVGTWLVDQVGLQLTFNQGFAFGRGGGTIAWLLPLAVTAGVAAWLRHRPTPALAIVFGGALGNTLERLLFGRVTDFVVLGPWPAFNMADTAITLGVAYLVWWELFGRARLPG